LLFFALLPSKFFTIATVFVFLVGKKRSGWQKHVGIETDSSASVFFAGQRDRKKSQQQKPGNPLFNA